MIRIFHLCSLELWILVHLINCWLMWHCSFFLNFPLCIYLNIKCHSIYDMYIIHTQWFFVKFIYRVFHNQFLHSQSNFSLLWSELISQSWFVYISYTEICFVCFHDSIYFQKISFQHLIFVEWFSFKLYWMMNICLCLWSRSIMHEDLYTIKSHMYFWCF